MGKRYRCVKSHGGLHFTPGKVYIVDDDGSVISDLGSRFDKHREPDGVKWLEKQKWYDFEEVTDIFTKDDLKTGMIAQTRNGAYWLVLRDTGCASEHHDGIVCIGDPHRDCFLRLSQFDETLGFIGVDDYDIVKVVAPRYYPYVNNPAEDMENGKLLFDRSKIEERKKLTVEEIERLLGYKVAIVDEEGK